MDTEEIIQGAEIFVSADMVSGPGGILTVKGVNQYLENTCLCMFFMF